MAKDRVYRHFKALDKLIFVKAKDIFLLWRRFFGGENFLTFYRIAQNFTVFYLDDAVCVCGDIWIVRNDDDGVALLVQIC